MSANEGVEVRTWRTVYKALREPFEDHELKPKAVYARGTGFVALALTYISREHVQKRLNDVLGPGNWTTSFKVIDVADKIVECTLGVRLSPEDDFVFKTDVGGGQGETETDTWKGAYSDAFKRAATHPGVGLYLYDLERQYLPCEAEMRDGRPKFKKWIGGANPATGEVNTSVPAQTKIDEWERAVDEFESILCHKCNGPCYGKFTAGKPTRPSHLAAWCSNPACETSKYRGYAYPFEKVGEYNRRKAAPAEAAPHPDDLPF
jgi:hypothetical protein